MITMHSLMGNGMKDRGARRNAIFQIYMNTGAYEADEVNAMLDKYGYAQGGIIGLKEGGSYMRQIKRRYVGTYYEYGRIAFKKFISNFNGRCTRN